MAGLDGALAHPDVPVFPQAAVGHLGLLHPFRGVADNHLGAESLWDADRDAVRPVCPDMVDAIPECHRGLQVRLVWAVGKSAVREPRPADAVPARLDSALAAFPGRLALVGLVERWARGRAAAEPCTPDEVQSEA
jgi:hypothetical protein